MRYTDCTEQQESLNATCGGDFVDIKADFFLTVSLTTFKEKKNKEAMHNYFIFFFLPPLSLSWHFNLKTHPNWSVLDTCSLGSILSKGKF